MDTQLTIALSDNPFTKKLSYREYNGEPGIPISHIIETALDKDETGQTPR